MFAVVDNRVERDRVLCFLRYLRTGNGWRKQCTDEANALLQVHYPEYLHYSPNKDARLHAVPVTDIAGHYRPGSRLTALISGAGADPVERDLMDLCRLYQAEGVDLSFMGVTGSLLIGAQNARSDLDLVAYDRNLFHRARNITRDLIERNLLQNLSAADWEDSYRRRSCHLDLSDYVWHESRKYNKAVINGRKFDLSYVGGGDDGDECFVKRGRIRLQCRVLDAERGFDYPAVFKIAHPEIVEVVSFTATYTGQAVAGEMIEVSGFLEQSEGGAQRIVVGSSREAGDEYIKVVQSF